MLFLFISELDASDVKPSYSAIDPMELAFHGIDALLFLFIFSYTHHFFFFTFTLLFSIFLHITRYSFEPQIANANRGGSNFFFCNDLI